MQKTHRAVGSPPGLDAIEELVHAGVVHADDKGAVRPQLAEAVPTIENGLWKVFPDGRMETTWTLREAARWHDGVRVTSGDLLFTAAVEQDGEIGIPRNPTYDLIESIEALDARTVTVRWKQPYIEADATFSYRLAVPLPRHLLERTYAEDKANFLGAPYWTQEFVGAGPYRMHEWVMDSHVLLRAYDGYVLGRPRIDEIEVKFITDPSTLVANLLAGGVDVTLGRTLLPVEHAQGILAQWRGSRAATGFRSWYPIHTQFINPNPPVITDVRFRRAMLQAIDRQQFVDSLAGGQSFIAHTFVAPDTAEYQQVESSAVRYDYDPRSAIQAIETLGYLPGPDGFFADAAGQRLSVQLYTTTRSEIQPKITLSVADYWKQIGVDVDPVLIPPQRIGDREYRAQFPAFEMISGSNGVSPEEIRRLHSRSTPLPENRFQVTGNNARYRSGEMDSLVEKYVTTVPRAERMEALRQIVHHRTDQLPSLGLFYEVDFTMISARLDGVLARGALASQAWNAHEWTVRG
jgi:peptide/nickel transport system substrate-binding protein